jgi:hypothetical protein
LFFSMYYFLHKKSSGRSPLIGISWADGLQGGKKGRRDQQNGKYNGHTGVYHHEVVHSMDDHGGGKAEKAPDGGFPEAEHGNAYPAPAGAVEGGGGKGPQEGNAQVGGAIGGGLNHGETQAGKEACGGTEIIRGKGGRFRKTGENKKHDKQDHQAAGFFGKGNLYYQPEEKGTQVKVIKGRKKTLEKTRDEQGKGAA